MRIKHLIILAALLVAPFSAASPAQAGGVVTVCDEAHLLAALAGGGTVTFACSGVITLSNTIVIAADTTIDGSGQDVTISGNHRVRVLNVNAGVTLDLNGLTVASGSADFTAGGGGGITSRGTVNATRCTFNANSAISDGGAIYNLAGTLTVNNSTFTSNSVMGGGSAVIHSIAGALTVNNSTFSNNGGMVGGIYNSGGILIVTDSVFSGNTCSAIYNANLGTLTVNNSTFSENYCGNGAGINNEGGRVDVSSSTFFRNCATGGGGGIYSHDGTVTVSNSTFSSNIAGHDGGGICWYIGVDGSVTRSNSSLSGISASGDSGEGGGINNDGGSLSVSSSTFFGNSADHDGGGINSDGTLIVSKSIFLDNRSGGIGGGIAHDGFGMLTVRDSSFSGNRANSGGGIYTYGQLADKVTVSGSTFSDNSADQGGGICCGATLSVTNSTFFDNVASRLGGGIFNSYGSILTVRNSTFAGNSAGDRGGGIFNFEETETVSYNTFADNSARGTGGIRIAPNTTTMLMNSIVASSPNGHNCSGLIIDGGGNLSYPDATCPGINADPLLGPLQDNGGPTWTMEPGPGSAAIDAGNDATCAADPVNNLDQRGVIRPVGPHCDIGAVEVNYLPVRTWLPILLAQ